MFDYEASRASAEVLSIRGKLIAETVAFARKGSQLPGVVRIALIGSLTTSKPDPKDADLLVTATDDADLAPLATLGRRLKGRAQGMNLGADIFLCDPRGNYLGRICNWKECGPGIRASCDALHCGRRHYLHDDFADIKLDRSLILAPPLELWPTFVARVPLPEDLRRALASDPSIGARSMEARGRGVKTVQEEKGDGLVFAAHNHHGADCGTPPAIDENVPSQYIGYFENSYGEQAIFVYERDSGRATLRMGDYGWDHPIQVVDGGAIGVVLTPAELLWLQACWLAATGR
ncbi:MAG: hypothetical protein HY675_00335 [Chloroflexi bacterium]|nr:hypothetical protein [Chloroflexota bacterium]